MPKLITGATRILGIIGDPIAQVRAPEVWTGLFQHNGVNAVCIPMQVKPALLKEFLAGAKALRNFAGLIVTIPHKPATLEQMGEPTERATRVGAVNIIRWDDNGKLQGDIVDGAGFVRGLQSRGQDVKGKRALVVGSGGVGTAIAFAIAESGAAEVAVADVATDRAQSLATRISDTGVPSRVSAPAAKGFDVIVNASPMGMKPDDPVSIDCTDLSASTVVADVVVHPQMTKLLTLAKERSCFVQPGTYMMDYQLAEMAPFFGFEGDYGPDAIAHVVAKF